MNFIRFSILSSVGFLLYLGVTTLASASVWHHESWHYQQLRWIALGLPVGVLAGCAGCRPLARFRIPWILYGLALLLLALVLVPALAHRVNGARRWLWGLQPSEFAKPALIILLAAYCSQHLSEMGQWKEGFVRPGLLVLPMLALTFAEPDWGTAILLGLVAAIMLSVAGVPWRRLIVTGTIALLFLAVALWFSPVHRARFTAFLDPERWKDSYAWQPWLGILSLGCGHWFGVGLGDGLLRLGFVPEQHTDSILTLVGEEWGLCGTSLVILAVTTLVLSGSWIAWRASDPFAKLLAIGITFLIGLQAFINIGVAVSVLPDKGIPLPFASYGGSSVVTLLACVGLLLGIEARNPRPAKPAARGADRDP